MLKRTIEVLFFGGTVPLGLLLVYSFFYLFGTDSSEEFYRFLSIVMLLIILIGVILTLFIFRFSFSPKIPRDRIRSLIGRKVFTLRGDFVGTVKDVLLASNTIYGLKIIISAGKLKNKKAIIKRKEIKVYGDVILVDDKVIED
jgi:sporulation protein YlmC with PRC-barrel domain